MQTSRLHSLRKHVSASREPVAAGGIPLPPTRLLGAGGLALLGAALLRYCRGIKVRGAQADTAEEVPWVVCEDAAAAVTAAPQQSYSQGPVIVPFLSQVPSFLADRSSKPRALCLARDQN